MAFEILSRFAARILKLYNPIKIIKEKTKKKNVYKEGSIEINIH